MPRVLLFTNTVAPYRLPVFQKLSQAVDLQVIFAHPKSADRRWDGWLSEYSFRHTVLPHLTLRLGSAAQVINPSLLAYLMCSDFDVAILGDNRQTTISGLLMSWGALVRRRPLIVWTGITPGEARIARSSVSLQRLLALYQRCLFGRATAIVTYGSVTRRYMANLGVPEENLFSGTQVVPEGQLPPPAANKSALGLSEKTVILSVNYLLPRKGLDVLIKAFLLAAGPKDVLVLAGSGPEEDRLRSLAGGDSRILFPGYQSGADKTAWYAAADLFVFPTLHDPWGLVVNEAMAFGLPIIVTDAAGCIPDLLRDNGSVVPAGDVEALAEALSQLLSDEALRHEMGRRSRGIIAPYTVEFACRTFVQAIQYALENP